MPTGWDNVDKTVKNIPSGSFIKLKSGESIKGVFRGEPRCFFSIFNDKTEYEAYVPGSSFRFKIPFVVKENGAYVAKIFSQGKRFWEMLKKCKEKYGLDKVFEISREGSTKDDTVYSLLYEGDLSKDELEQIGKVKLPALVSNNEGSDDDYVPPGDFNAPEDDNLPF